MKSYMKQKSNLFNKFLLISVISIIFGTGHTFAKKLNIYDCENLYEAELCKKCKRVPRLIYTNWEFRVNDKNGTVLRIINYDDGSSQSSIFPNCKIFDVNNWECNETTILPDRKIYSDFKMLNGIFSTGSYSTFISKLEPSLSKCGK
jgi:hypothetical protein